MKKKSYLLFKNIISIFIYTYISLILKGLHKEVLEINTKLCKPNMYSLFNC